MKWTLDYLEALIDVLEGKIPEKHSTVSGIIYAYLLVRGKL